MAECGCDSGTTASLERRTLLVLLWINGVMFFLEAVTGWIADSTGLIADSLDMLADASVYGIALYAVGRSQLVQCRAGAASGYLQMVLGAGVFVDVVRRFIYGSDPQSHMMMIIGGIALAANVTCLLLLAKHRDGGIHMRASWIFSTNDVIANVSVIVSGVLVAVLGSRVPDLVIGLSISLLVIRGGVRILREARGSRVQIPVRADVQPR
jgi:cation diffusion facilitator family transporter